MRLRDFTQDEMTFVEAYWQNEYRLPDSFDPADVIVDVGAHIGCFALACLRRQARNVRCYEADPANFSLLLENMERYSPLVVCEHQAVWRSDREEGVSLYRYENPTATAMHFVRPHDPKMFKCSETAAVALDAILRDYQEVRLLKLDCEGSEYPILYTSKELGRVQEIVMETHEKMGFEEWSGKCNSKALAHFLRDKGFVVGPPEPNPLCADINHHLFARRP